METSSIWIDKVQRLDWTYPELGGHFGYLSGEASETVP